MGIENNNPYIHSTTMLCDMHEKGEVIHVLLHVLSTHTVHLSHHLSTFDQGDVKR